MMIEKKNILVTGGAGYIGSHVVRDLGESGRYNPVVYDNLSAGSRSAVLYGEFIHGDTGDFPRLLEVIRSRKIRGVIHMAASIVVSDSMARPLDYYRNNTVHALNLIRACIAGGVNHFVFSSTAAVYGLPEKLPVSEKSPPAPINPYGMSKFFVERILEDTARAHPGFHYTCLRYFNVAGADHKARMGQDYARPTHLVTRALRTALGRYPGLSIFGTDYPTPDGTAIRDYIHIDDLASAHLAALSHLQKTRRNHIFNCGYGRGFSVKEVVESVRKITGTNFKVIPDARRSGDPPVLIADPRRILQEMEWKPRHDNLEEILRCALKWEQKLLQRDRDKSIR